MPYNRAKEPQPITNASIVSKSFMALKILLAINPKVEFTQDVRIYRNMQQHFAGKTALYEF
ncbi:MAG: hypothetical protein O2970_03295 [Proteobacteria bacterium]|nr:hypothetical protein [Pseudomonadota bacterium]